MSPVFALPAKRFRLRWIFPYLFGHFCEVLFQWPPQCRTISVCPLISLALSPDRFYRIDHLFLSFFLSLSLALSDFSIDYSVRVFRSLFSTFLLALFLSRAEALYGTTGDLRETRPYFAFVFRFFFVFAFVLFGYSLSHSSRTEHNGRIVQPVDSPAPLHAVRSTIIALFRARPPLQLRSLCIRVAANVDLPFSCSTRLILAKIDTNNVDL